MFARFGGAESLPLSYSTDAKSPEASQIISEISVTRYRHRIPLFVRIGSIGRLLFGRDYHTADRSHQPPRNQPLGDSSRFARGTSGLCGHSLLKATGPLSEPWHKKNGHASLLQNPD